MDGDYTSDNGEHNDTVGDGIVDDDDDNIVMRMLDLMWMDYRW